MARRADELFINVHHVLVHRASYIVGIRDKMYSKHQLYRERIAFKEFDDDFYILEIERTCLDHLSSSLCNSCKNGGYRE
jgi:hypothetical protein